ncbi:hypothetical protein F0562_029792 [Nyssa sinensis]|uniref:G protein gamma domain-containing protein n=1 Tax=Nyssa sinensis TaxID=561372 RepID=A0A5J5AY47_9ASTE|nr:hypothetical protein F0562_029792 [Nyssa sinensis]
MANSGGSSSLPPPRPKSPPMYQDLYGKRRELAKVQMLEREIGFLEEELKSIGSLQPASQCCKDVADFVVSNSDPLIPTSQKIRRSCRFWKWLCGPSCFNFSWISCYGCCPCLKLPRCCYGNICNCKSCVNCSRPKCQCCFWPCSECFDKMSCSRSCCTCQCPSCPDCSCSRCTCSCPKCPKVHLCSCCTKNCCYRCCLCY